MTRMHNLLFGAAAALALCATSAQADIVGAKHTVGVNAPCQHYTFDFSAFSAKQQIGAISGYAIGSPVQPAFLIEPKAWHRTTGATIEARYTTEDMQNAHYAPLGTSAYGLNRANRTNSSSERLAAIGKTGWTDAL